MTMGGGAQALYNGTTGLCPSGDKNVFWLEISGKSTQADAYITIDLPANCTTTCTHSVLGFDETRAWWASRLGGCSAPVHTTTGLGVLSDVYSYPNCNNTVNAVSPFFEAGAVTNGGHMWCQLDSVIPPICLTDGGTTTTHSTSGFSTANYMWKFFATRTTTN